MNFLYYDITFLAIFIIALVSFLIIKRKNIKVESKVFFLYPTKFGVKFIYDFAKKHQKSLNIWSYIIIVAGYLLMAVSIFLFIDLFRILFQMPALFKVIKVPPIMPIFPYFTNVFKVDYLPTFYFTYWIVSIAIIAVFHEFAHGIFARLCGVRVKSTGFGFLGPFIAAFVEPDEKQLAKKSKKSQIAMLSAGSFANLMLTIIFAIAIVLFVKLLFVPSGLMFDTYLATSLNVSDIKQIDYMNFSDFNVAKFAEISKDIDANGYISVKEGANTVNLTRIATDKGIFFSTKDALMLQADMLQKSETGNEQIVVFEDTPALKSGLSGAISKINGVPITSLDILKEELGKYKPNDELTIETSNSDGNKQVYTLNLAEDKENKTRAILGIAFFMSQEPKFISKIFSYAKKIGDKIRDPRLLYVPKWNPSLTLFIYNLFWWVVFLNLSVALVNMLPLGIFDGGRVFFLTILAITKSEKKAKLLSKIVMIFILLAFIALTLMWMFYK